MRDLLCMKPEHFKENRDIKIQGLNRKTQKT